MARPNRGIGTSGVKRPGGNGTRTHYSAGGCKSTSKSSGKK